MIPAISARLAARINDYWMRHRRPDKLRVVVPRRAALFARSRRSVSLPVPEDGAAAAQRARHRGIRGAGLVPVALRSHRVAEAVYAVVLRGWRKRGPAVSTCSVRGSSRTASRRWRRSRSRASKTFVAAGGGELNYIPALNDHPAWYEAMGAIAWKHLQGWLDAPESREATRELQRATRGARLTGAP